MGKRSPLYDVHKQLSARFTDFGGWEMPVQYSTNIIKEHINTRENAGLFDISHMSEIEIIGKDSFKFVQYLITNDIARIGIGKALYTPLCYEDGTFVDDVIIYMLEKDKFFIVANASNREKDIDWITKVSKGFNLKISDVSNKTAGLALQGPKAEEILKKITKTDICKLTYFEFIYEYLNNFKVLISRTGYTGEDGFELYFHTKYAIDIWNLILDVGDCFGILPAGLGARDTLRLEACLRLYGNDIDDTVTPIEAGLYWAVGSDKDDFMGKKALINHAKNVTKKLVAFEMFGNHIARHKYHIFKEECKIGYVTSGSFSPSLEKPIGLGYVDTKFANIGEIVEVLIRNKYFKAIIVPMPFISKNKKDKRL